MFKLKSLLAISIVGLFIATPLSQAVAADVPLLTWERGRIQQVVVGGGAVENNWQMTLEGKDIEPMQFQPSRESNAGYAIFTIQLPNDLPTGGYTVVSTGNRSPRTVVAGINVIESLSYQITSVPNDLTKVIVIFVFLTALVTTLRSRKYANYSFPSTQDVDVSNPYLLDDKLLNRIKNFAYRWRIRTLANLPTSLFRYQVIREGELTHRLAKPIYSYLPLIGFIAGLIVTNESQKAGGIGSVGLAIFIAVGILGAFDVLSGMTATLGFWLSQIMVGNIASIRDVLIIVSVSIAWIAPALFSSLIREAVDLDLHKLFKNEIGFYGRLLGLLVSASFGGLLFYFGQVLLNSVLMNFTDTRNVSLLAIILIIIALLLKGVLDEVLVLSKGHIKTEAIARNEVITIARVTSPQTAIIVLVSTFSFAYIWTQSAQQSIISALLFSAPYFLVFIRLGKLKFKLIGQDRRYILLEPIVVAVLTLIIYSQISSVPLFADRRAELFLILAAVPAFLHGIYGLFCDSAEQREIINA
jgi:hypothetical protein